MDKELFEVVENLVAFETEITHIEVVGFLAVFDIDADRNVSCFGPSKRIAVTGYEDSHEDSGNDCQNSFHTTPLELALPEHSTG